MSEPLAVRIRTCATPAEALLLLAEAIDALEERNAATAQDPWAAPLQWGSEPKPDLPRVEPSRDAVANRIERLKAKRDEADDPADVRALDAQIRMAEDELVVMPNQELEKARTVRVENENGMIEVPAVSKERVAERMQYAAENRFVEYLSTAEAVKAGNGEAEWLGWFGKVGPKGLYIADRDAIMRMPVACKYWLVEDMAKDDIAYSQNIGIDVLKPAEKDGDKEEARKRDEPTWQT